MMPFARAALFPLLLVAVAAAAEKSTGLPKNSPFMPAGGAAGPVEGAKENIEFAGVSSIGSKTDLIFYDKTAKKNHWIAVGESKEGISVVKYDERREQATVKVNGVEKILALRKGNASTGAPRAVAGLPASFNTPTPAAMPLPAPVNPTSPAMNPAPVADVSAAAPAPSSAPAAASTPPPVPDTPQAKQETEARMLVSDLLEIGMAQRKAYEEAQRKAAEGNAQNPATATPAAPPNPVPSPPPAR